MKVEKFGGHINCLDSMYPCRIDTAGPGDTVLCQTLTDTVYGVVLSGTVHVEWHGGGGKTSLKLPARSHFSFPGVGTVYCGDGAVALISRCGFRGQFVAGNIEAKGRLTYIDGCSDTILVYPPRQGDPVLNHLYFPRGVLQTQHTHPSVRLGVVVAGSGHGWRNKHGGNYDPYPANQGDPDGWEVPLNEGDIFLLEENEIHSFRTDKSGQPMHIVAFHPDSDWGPVDGNHPMLNRTYVR